MNKKACMFLLVDAVSRRLDSNA